LDQCPLLLPIGRDAAAKQFYEAAADLAAAIQQFAGSLQPGNLTQPINLLLLGFTWP
jgi:hypothetical protein